MRIALCLSVVVALLGAAGCGGGGSKPAPKFKGTPDPTAGRVAKQYIDAYAAKKPKRICALLASSVRAQLGGKKCAPTVKKTLAGIAFPKLVVKKSLANKTTAQVTFKDSLRIVTLTREGGVWKVIDGGN